jgi:hypothetical protein
MLASAFIEKRLQYAILGSNVYYTRRQWGGRLRVADLVVLITVLDLGSDRFEAGLRLRILYHVSSYSNFRPRTWFS